MSPYRPGERSAAWLKRKQKLSFEVIVTGGSAKRIAQGDWGEAVMLEMTYSRDGLSQSSRPSGSLGVSRSSSRRSRRAELVVLGRDAERLAAAPAIPVLGLKSRPIGASRPRSTAGSAQLAQRDRSTMPAGCSAAVRPMPLAIDPEQVRRGLVG
jgi:hypothetical protein